jgi:hypothetical protein
VLDAIARAAGETQQGGALRYSGETMSTALLVNVATGIAGAMVVNGKVLLSHEQFGDVYGQFGRFLFLNRKTNQWRWRTTPDGSIPGSSADELRWTQHCAGPALARRIAEWCFLKRIQMKEDSIEVEALRYFASAKLPRIPKYETALLHWTTEEIYQNPKGPMEEIARQFAHELGTALSVLMQIFQPARITKIVLAGGVGENFGRRDAAGRDEMIENIVANMNHDAPVICRANLGVDAELLGLSQLH